MDLEQLLNDYDQITSECRALLEQEIFDTRNGTAGVEDFDSKKRDLIDALDGKLSQLKEVQARMEGMPNHLKSDLDHVQQKFMQIMQLNRELEKLYLSVGRQSANAPVPDLARARNAYGRY